MPYSDFVEVDGLRLHYRRTGEPGDSRPGVVLAHGFSDDGACWLPVASELEAEFDVVMPDARGHGKSDAPESGYGTLEQASDLAGIIQALGLRRPMVLGHSMGGATSYALAANYPDLPGAILIEDAGALNIATTETTEEQKQRWAGMRRWVDSVLRKTHEELLTEQRTATPHWSEEELLPWAESKQRLSYRVLNRSDAPPVDWSTLLPKITCPALLIIGDKANGGFVTMEMAQEIRKSVPQLEIAHIAGAGHSIRRDRFPEYMNAVRTFLRRHTV